MAENYRKKDNPYFDALDREGINRFEIVSVAAQATRLLNNQIKMGLIDLKHKPTTEALQKVLDGRVIRLEEEE